MIGNGHTRHYKSGEKKRYFSYPDYLWQSKHDKTINSTFALAILLFDSFVMFGLPYYFTYLVYQYQLYGPRGLDNCGCTASFILSESNACLSKWLAPGDLYLYIYTYPYLVTSAQV